MSATPLSKRPDAPALNFAPELLLRAQGRGGGMRAALFDVDGVLTDGRLYIGAEGEGFKAFHVLDGHGLKLLATQGIQPVVITGRDAPAPALLIDGAGPRPAPEFVEWLMGLPPGWITAPAHRFTPNQQITALGNGVVPLQALTALALSMT